MENTKNDVDETCVPNRQSLELADVLQKPSNGDTLLDGIFPVFVHPNVAQSEQVSSMIREGLADPDNWLPRIEFVKAAASLCELLEKVRNFRDDLPCFFIIDEQSIEKQAVLAVETNQMCPEDYDDLPANWDGIKHLCNLESDQLYCHPEAAHAHKFHIVPNMVATMAIASLAGNLGLGNLCWEEFEDYCQDGILTKFSSDDVFNLHDDLNNKCEYCAKL